MISNKHKKPSESQLHLFRIDIIIMEEHGMFVGKSVEEGERNEHEKYLRVAIKVNK